MNCDTQKDVLKLFVPFAFQRLAMYTWPPGHVELKVSSLDNGFEKIELSRLFLSFHVRVCTKSFAFIVIVVVI